MAEATTIARPYAQAVFELAKGAGKLAGWSDALTLLSAVASEKSVSALISNPNVTSDQLVEFFVSICADKLDQEGKSFLKVLAENGRLNVMSEIAANFDELKAEAEKTVKAEVVTAFELDAKQTSKLEAALKKRLGCEVEITSRVDNSIIGGAIIRAGDMIIDGSVTTQLDRLSSDLAH
ncbi:MAG: F0F1 ATP synthase subunit delta [Gammaproteobacteria bacterium]|nr:F0F1 ATP synthase subunit delta [Gammaproteobacteria bacterium]